jgi:hypothetical protein
MAVTHNISFAAARQITCSALLVKRLTGNVTVIDCRRGLIKKLYDEKIIMMSSLLKIFVITLGDTAFSRLQWSCKKIHCEAVSHKAIQYAGRFIMFSMITNTYNKKTKGPTLMGFFTATGKLKNAPYYPLLFKTANPYQIALVKYP